MVGIQVVQMNYHALFPNGKYLRNSVNTLTKFEKFLRNARQISTKLGTEHVWVKGTSCPFPRVDNNKIVRNTLTKFKILLLQKHWTVEFQPNFKALYVLVIFHCNYKDQINSNEEVSDFLSMIT